MSTPTPGPWHVNAIRNGRIVGDGSNGERYDALHIAGANSTVARVYHLADARLIALAPELLANLAYIVAILDAGDTLNMTNVPPLPGAITKARALLAQLDATP